MKYVYETGRMTKRTAVGWFLLGAGLAFVYYVAPWLFWFGLGLAGVIVYLCVLCFCFSDPCEKDSW